MIQCDDLGFGYPTFPAFVAMLKDYERDLRTYAPPPALATPPAVIPKPAAPTVWRIATSFTFRSRQEAERAMALTTNQGRELVVIPAEADRRDDDHGYGIFMDNR
jgi:hypothetical protein